MADMKFEIPHNLGKAEARLRIEAGMPKLAAHISFCCGRSASAIAGCCIRGENQARWRS
jgi:hypothetical protein